MIVASFLAPYFPVRHFLNANKMNKRWPGDKVVLLIKHQDHYDIDVPGRSSVCLDGELRNATILWNRGVFIQDDGKHRYLIIKDRDIYETSRETQELLRFKQDLYISDSWL